jgi:hypothetical protein
MQVTSGTVGKLVADSPSGRRQAFRRLCAGVLGGAMVFAAAVQAAEPVSVRPDQSRPAHPRSPAGRTEATRANEPANGRRPKVDHAVKQAVGVDSGQAKCSQCQRSTCPHCQPVDRTHRGHHPCQHGLCPAHCPVRPDVFGFYGTQWRRWPGSRVVQASNNEAATPAQPPAAEVPGPGEESPETDAADEHLPVPAAEAMPAETGSPDAADEGGAAAGSDEQTGEVQLDDESALGDATSAVPSETSTEADTAAVQGPAEEVASSTAWRSFTAAERRLRENRR